MTSGAVTDELHIGDHVGNLAAAHPDRLAMVAIGARGDETAMTWSEFDSRANGAAHVLMAEGVAEGTVVGVALPSGFDHAVSVIGAWRLGATVVPMNPRAGSQERRVLREAVGGPVIGTGTWADLAPGDLNRATDTSPVSGRGVPRSATVSGGSTGAPRLIMRDRPWTYADGEIAVARDRLSGAVPGWRQLVVLPLYHLGFSALYKGLAAGQLNVLLTRFSPEQFFAAIERHRIQYMQLAPSYMRMALDASNLESYDLQSVEAVYHGSGSCPIDVKRRWIELFGAEKIIETYSSIERVGAVQIRGDEWLQHPGSVGRATLCEIRVLDDDGRDLPPGEVGLVYMGGAAAHQPEYLGAGPSLPEHDGYYWVGDLGYLDEDGYLYLIDRKANVINSGGIDVYPAEIEAILLRHPDVVDVAVVGRPHKYLGKYLHGIVVPRDPNNPPTPDDLEQLCRKALTAAKVPLTYEVRRNLGRSETGKLQRSEL